MMSLNYDKGRPYVFDTGAFALYFGGDERVKGYFDEVFSGLREGITCSLIIGEFWYKVCEKLGAKKAEDFKRRILASVINIINNDELTIKASEIKCKYRGRFSFVDCHIYALASIYRGILITTDTAFKDLKEIDVIYIEVS